MGHKRGKQPLKPKYRQGPPVTYSRIAQHAKANCTGLLGDSAVATKVALLVCTQFEAVGGQTQRVARSAEAARDQIRQEFSTLERAQIDAIDRGVKTACQQLRNAREELIRASNRPVTSSEPRMGRR